MVRFLCIHGLGTNGTIFKAQTAGIRSHLPAHWEYEFPDAELECGPAPGVDSVYPGPYFCLFKVPSVHSFQEAHDLILDIIDQKGPFDGVIGFSEGGGTALSLMLSHQKENPFAPPIFRHATFICSTLPWSASHTAGFDVTPLIIRRRKIPSALTELKSSVAAVKEEADYDPSSQGQQDGIPPALHQAVEEIGKGDFKYEDYVTRKWHPEVDAVRLQIPTAFVFGKEDDLLEGGKKMMELCDPKYVCGSHVHKGGHEIPKARADQMKIADLITKVVQRSELPS